MLIDRGRGEFVAVCEDCETASNPLGQTREIAILRLMRTRWRVRSGESVARTWCPCCQSSPSIPIIKVANQP